MGAGAHLPWGTARPQQQKTSHRDAGQGGNQREQEQRERGCAQCCLAQRLWRASRARVGEQHGRRDGREGGLAVPLPTAIKFYSSVASTYDFIASITEVELLQAPAPGVKLRHRKLGFHKKPKEEERGQRSRLRRNTGERANTQLQLQAANKAKPIF